MRDFILISAACLFIFTPIFAIAYLVDSVSRYLNNKVSKPKHKPKNQFKN